MSSRITLLNRSGQYLTEVNATCDRTYKLNEFGTATFTMSTSDDKCREDYLRFGNYVYVEHDKLPVWAGMIDTPRIWKHGAVEVTAYSGEYILTCFITGKSSTFSGVFGNVYKELIDQTMRHGGDLPLIEVGDIYGGGASVTRKYQWNGLYNEIIKLCKDSGNDFYFEPYINEYGVLYFRANWYEKRGMVKTFMLYEDMNIKLSSTPLREQGRIANKIYLWGEGASWSSKPVAQRENTVSRGLYGSRELAQAAQGTDIEANADQIIREFAYPRKTFDLTVIDTGDTFYQCRVGDQLPVSFHSVGFSGDGLGTNETVRILQMDYQEEQNQLKLVCDEVIE